MTFLHPWVLAFAIAPLAWLAWEWRRSTRYLRLLLKAASLVAIVLALAEPRLSISETKMAVAVLVDTSASVSKADLAKASQLVNGMEDAKSRNTLRVLPFARGIRAADPSEHTHAWQLKPTAGEAGRATDLDAAVTDAIGSLPAGLVPRLVLISDGKENAGSITRAAWEAQHLGIPVDTIALAGASVPNLRLESVRTPSLAFTGERFPVDLIVNSPRAAAGTVEISAEGRLLGSQKIRLEPGQNQLQVHVNVSIAGALNLSGVVNTDGLGSVRFDRAITLRKPRVLYLSQDPQETGTNLQASLTAAQFEIDRSSDPSHGTLGDYQLVVFNNWDLNSLPEKRKSELETFVKAGGGLLVIGGDRNVFAEGKTEEDALDRTLPAKVSPPRDPEGTSVVLIIDKSSSMMGKKITLARQAASSVVDHLRPIDNVGVLMFDNSFAWAVPMRRAEDRTQIKQLIAGIQPDGGTQIAPALKEAYRSILPTRAVFRHIVLLTDGISEEGDSMELSREALEQHVTISTIGLGEDVNRKYLENVAFAAGGKSYFLNEPAGLEQILLNDVKEHTGSTAVEKALKPAVLKPAEILEGVGMESAPPLKGYIRFDAKPTADTLLGINDKDPLLVRWQYGLGRAMIFTSDAKSRWAADWIGWKGYDKFWTNIFRDLLPHSQAGETDVQYDSATEDLVVNYRLGRDVPEPAKLPGVFVIGPDGFQHTLPVAKVADHAYRGRVHVGARQGLFRVRPLEDDRAFPEVGYYVPEQELEDRGSDEFLLREIADFTGGRFNPSAQQVFDAGGRFEASTMRVWPGLLAFALALNIIELILRKRVLHS